MTYICRLRHLTDQQLRHLIEAAGIALDRTYTGSIPALQRRNIRRRLWRLMDEQDRRRELVK